MARPINVWRLIKSKKSQIAGLQSWLSNISPGNSHSCSRVSECLRQFEGSYTPIL